MRPRASTIEMPVSRLEFVGMGIAALPMRRMKADRTEFVEFDASVEAELNQIRNESLPARTTSVSPAA